MKNCHNVIFRDFSIYHGGHFAILATGVDNWTCDNLKIDTNRDGIDFDCCQNVRVANCSVNSPYDDGICPKSRFALGYNRPTENVTITNCQVSGYDEGTLLDGTRGRTVRYVGGGTAEEAARVVPEDEKGSPEPKNHGTMPSWGMFARHVKNFDVSHVEFRATKDDRRATVQLEDVTDAAFDAVKFPHAAGAPSFALKNVNGFAIHNSPALPETKRAEKIADEKL